ncbi:hypothetical protein GF374_03315 [Candidatus Woesearchaeota archaeon]|nr:hypothetical protein [Candidatus Woesearchaeota archaeon]
MDIDIIEKEPLALPEVKKIISGLGKKAKLPDVQQKAHTFANEFGKISPAQAEKLQKELKELEIPMFTDEHIAQITNIVPQDLAELKSIFVGSKTTIAPENFKKILDIVLKYRK